MRTVLVTGASSGIGKAVSERLLADGHRVIGLARDFSKFRPGVPSFHPHPIDLSRLAELPERLQALCREHPDVCAVVANAGRGLFGNLEQLSAAEIRAVIDLNFTSQVFIARAFLPLLKKEGRGDLIFIGSEAALRGRSRGSLYCATKFAVRGLAQALREECAAAGVRVSIINPGMVKTPFFDRLDFTHGEAPENYLAPEDVAQLVSAMLSMRPGAVIDEVNLSPQKNVVRHRRGSPRGEGAEPPEGAR
jgi:NADP-dependent 3-hydroxy acid dehydrogenase YdfG